MNNELDKKWIKWIVLSVIVGFLLGLLVQYLICLVVTNTLIVSAVKGFSIPVFVVMFLLFTLYEYNKEKRDTIGG